uniref:VWFA domain-containing protein n=1 Tax=Ciona savignyi TaxID=51511 RepID=H2ZHS4_CIOSA
MFSAATGEVSNIAADSIVLLTDGRPTDGTIESTSITSTIQELNRGRFGIHTIGFGTLVDMPLLTKIAAQNFGTSSQIFIDLNAYAQISNFFETISQPILARPSLNYTENKVARYCPILSDSLMQNGELVTAGTIFPEFVVPQTRKAVTFNTVAFDDFGDTRRGTVTENGVVTPSVIDNLDGRNFAERLFNFLKLKGVLAEMRGTTNRTRETELRQLALNQSLELGFVTPGITSMVVLKPEDIREIENALAAERATTVAPATTTVPATDDVLGRLFTTTPAPSTSGPDRGFVGDPHVIVSLGLQITVCFNWLGRENEVYNLLE